MIQFIFDIAVIIGGILFTLFSILIFTVHKKVARLSLYLSLIIFAIAIYASYRKNSTDPDVKQYLLSKDAPTTQNDSSFNAKSKDLKSQKINSTYTIPEKNTNFSYGDIRTDSLNRLENMAYIVFHSIKSSEFKFNGDTTVILIQFKNVGKTLAQKIMPYTFYSLHEDSIEKQIQFGEKFVERHKSEGANLGGGDSTIYILHIGKFIKQDSISFTTYKPKIYFGGVVGYYDIFQTRHITDFCIETQYGLNAGRTYKNYNQIK